MLDIDKLKKNNINKNIIKDSGILVNESKHNPSATKEWFNSVYCYNKNNQKYLPSLDITISNLIKSYFNLFSRKLEKSILLRRVSTWRRRLRLNRVLIGKPEFKHTNDKVTIVLYVYNRELLILNSKMNKLKRKILTQYFLKIIVKNILELRKISIIKNIIKKIDSLKKEVFKLNNKKLKYITKVSIVRNTDKYKKVLFKFKKVLSYFKYIKQTTINRKNIYKAKSLKYLEYKIQKGGLKQSSLIKNLIDMYALNKDSGKNLYKELNSSVNKIPRLNISKLMYLEILKKMIIRMRLYLRYQKSVMFNKFKFNFLIWPLKTYIEKIYKKQVEFNIVSLKNYHLDSNILTQIVASKIKNRKINILKVINIVLAKVKLPLTRKLQYHNVVPKSNMKQNLLLKQFLYNSYKAIPSIDISSINKDSGMNLKKLNLIESKKDKLDNLLHIIYPTEFTVLKKNNKLMNKSILKRNIENTVLDTLKNKTITGLRIEASGRLSKRIIASKALFHAKQKGTIRNINSSYKRLSTVLLRGNFKSNVQYAKVSNKTRIGAFGLKGWISSI